MELDFAFLARSATAAEGELYVHGGALRVIETPQFPATFPISVIARFTASRDEIGSRHQLELRLSRADGSGATYPNLPAMEFDVEYGSHEEPEIEIGVVSVMSMMGLRVHQPGELLFQLDLDGVPQKVMPLRVVEGGQLRAVQRTLRAQGSLGQSS